MNQFKREDRYLVLKRKDLNKLDIRLQSQLCDWLSRASIDLPKRQYVCIESDWPEYEVAFKMIEARVNGVAATDASPTFDLVAHLHRQIAFSQRTFGPGMRTAGLFDHIIKELIEIEEKPSDLTEWVDLILLAFDGAWRAGHTAESIAQGIDAKQTKNEGRTWPDWRTAAPGKAIEHVRGAPPPPPPGPPSRIIREGVEIVKS